MEFSHTQNMRRREKGANAEKLNRRVCTTAMLHSRDTAHRCVRICEHGEVTRTLSFAIVSTIKEFLIFES